MDSSTNIGAKIIQAIGPCGKIAWVGKASGQTLVEYAIILALVSVVVIFLLITMGDSIRSIFNTIIDAFNNV